MDESLLHNEAGDLQLFMQFLILWAAIFDIQRGSNAQCRFSTRMRKYD